MLLRLGELETDSQAKNNFGCLQDWVWVYTCFFMGSKGMSRMERNTCSPHQLNSAGYGLTMHINVIGHVV